MRNSVATVLTAVALCSVSGTACGGAPPETSGRNVIIDSPHERGALAPAGTYSMVVCQRSACGAADTVQAIAWGTLTLLESTLADSITRGFEWIWGTRPNGCLDMRIRTRARSLAGTEGQSITEWSVQQGQVVFFTYRSPDAGHQVIARLSGDTLRGKGRSWEDMGKEEFSEDYVTAVRVGPPDASRCVKRTTR
jgi:hypothetical protein